MNDLLGTRSRVAVLRALLAAGDELTGREVARLAGVNHQSAHDALATFTAAGVAIQVRRGRAFSYRFNTDHALIQGPLEAGIAAERRFWPLLQEELRRGFARRAAAVILFGSAARGQETPGSDVDLLLLARFERQKAGLMAMLDARAPKVRRRFGVTLAGVVYTLDEFRRLIRSGNPLARSILREGRALAGRIPRDFRHGA